MSCAQQLILCLINLHGIFTASKLIKWLHTHNNKHIMNFQLSHSILVLLLPCFTMHNILIGASNIHQPAMHVQMPSYIILHNTASHRNTPYCHWAVYCHWHQHDMSEAEEARPSACLPAEGRRRIVLARLRHHSSSEPVGGCLAPLLPIRALTFK